MNRNTLIFCWCVNYYDPYKFFALEQIAQNLSNIFHKTMAIFKLKYLYWFYYKKLVFAQTDTIRPPGSILTQASAHSIDQTMVTEGLFTSAQTPLAPSYKPNNTIRPHLGLVPVSSETNKSRNLCQPMSHGRPGKDPTSPSLCRLILHGQDTIPGLNLQRLGVLGFQIK